MSKIKKEREYGEKIRNYFFTFVGCFIGFVVLVFITNLESKIFFTGFILLIIGFVGFFIYSFYVSQKLADKRAIILAQSISELKDMKKGGEDQKYTEQDLLDILNAIADKKSPAVVNNGMPTFDNSRNRRDKHDAWLKTLDRSLGTNFRLPCH